VVLAERLDLPSPELVAAVVREPLHLDGGRVLASDDDALPAELEQALAALADDLAANPFSAPTADRLRELGLDATRTAAAAKAGRLLRLAPGIVLLPGADVRAVEQLSALPQPFTTSEARSRLGTSRRVVLPLLEHLDRAGLTRRLPDDRRLVV
jgi:selenocysteine-specific elongation factor